VAHADKDRLGVGRVTHLAAQASAVELHRTLLPRSGRSL
jgi:hypothetical protein